jgi:hypothetical protein
MIKYIRNHFKKRREFKESIRGIFDDWECIPLGWVGALIHTKDKTHCLIYTSSPGGSFFDSEHAKKNFLERFAGWEKRLLEQELKIKIACVTTENNNEGRQAINKEFNLK